jgi:hypothetical protein
MSSGFWVNQDGLPLQFGTQKAIPEQGGDWLMYGENREVETYIPLGVTQIGGTAAVPFPGLPSTFTGTGTPAGTTLSAGIVSMTTMFPLMDTAPVTTSTAGGVLAITQPQLFIDQIDFEVVIPAVAGTGGATGLTGIGLVAINPATQAFVQIGPNAGLQLLGAATTAKMAAGMHYTWYADGTAFGTGTPPVAGAWLGNVPLMTGFAPVVEKAYISAICSGGPYTGTNAGGLNKLRVRYNYYGSINF